MSTRKTATEIHEQRLANLAKARAAKAAHKAARLNVEKGPSPGPAAKSKRKTTPMTEPAPVKSVPLTKKGKPRASATHIHAVRSAAGKKGAAARWGKVRARRATQMHDFSGISQSILDYLASSNEGPGPVVKPSIPKPLRAARLITHESGMRAKRPPVEEELPYAEGIDYRDIAAEAADEQNIADEEPEESVGVNRAEETAIAFVEANSKLAEEVVECLKALKEHGPSNAEFVRCSKVIKRGYAHMAEIYDTFGKVILETKSVAAPIKLEMIESISELSYMLSMFTYIVTSHFM